MKRFALATAIASGLLIHPHASSPAAPAVARFTANALNIGGDAGPVATLMQIDIERWSTEDEHNRLVAPLPRNGQSEAASVLRHLTRVGMIRALDLAGDPIYYARKTTGADKTEHVVLIGIRPMRAFERATGVNMSAFPFSVIDLSIDASGSGSGLITLAATLTGAPEKPIGVVPDRIVDRVRLTSVKRVGK